MMDGQDVEQGRVYKEKKVLGEGDFLGEKRKEKENH